MGRRDIENELGALKALQNTTAEEQTQQLRKALRDRVNLIVAKSASIVASLQLRALIPDLCAAFDRMFEKAVERDPQCWAKNAIAKALGDFGYDESGPFLRGLRYVQLEPVWGRFQDTAFTLRSTCALALPVVRDLPRREILQQLCFALTDSYEADTERERAEGAPVRRDAVRAIESMGGEEPGLVLRLKARTGDPDSSVTGQIFDSLLRMERAMAIPFVEEALAWPNELVREEAIMALGASHLAEATAVLEQTWRKTDEASLREAILRALGVCADERAIAFLLTVIRDGMEREAKCALSALRLHEVPEQLRQRIAEAVASRGEGRPLPGLLG